MKKIVYCQFSFKFKIYKNISVFFKLEKTSSLKKLFFQYNKIILVIEFLKYRKIKVLIIQTNKRLVFWEKETLFFLMNNFFSIKFLSYWLVSLKCLQ